MEYDPSPLPLKNFQICKTSQISDMVNLMTNRSCLGFAFHVKDGGNYMNIV